MAFADRHSIDPKQRLGSIGLIAVLHGLVLWALIVGMGISAGQMAEPVQSALQTIFLTEPEPAPPPPPPDGNDAGDEGAPSQAGLEADASPVLASDIVLPSENLIAAAPDPLEGVETETGQTDIDDSGAGSDLAGDSTGTGDSGTGPGGGGTGSGTGSGPVTPAVKIAGNIGERDFRAATGFSAIPGEATVYYTVQPNGRVTGCYVEKSSGNTARDALTCRLIEERWRYRPARDANGNPVAYETGWNQRWWPRN